MKTKRDIQATTKGGLPFVIPKGSPVEPAKLGPGEIKPRYWVSPSVFPPGSIERHDAETYGISVNEEDVEP